MGQRASFGIGQFNSFWAYTTPIIGAIIADEYLGRFNTIFIAIAFSIIGHVLLVISAIPSVLTSGKAIGPFILGVIMLGFGTGAFKANISPLIAEQYRQSKPRVVVDKKTGERVITDPNITISRIFLYFYMFSKPSPHLASPVPHHLPYYLQITSSLTIRVSQHGFPHRPNFHGLR
jgi:POT family proton-dependent oligopeptide transporter